MEAAIPTASPSARVVLGGAAATATASTWATDRWDNDWAADGYVKNAVRRRRLGLVRGASRLPARLTNKKEVPRPRTPAANKRRLRPNELLQKAPKGPFICRL